MAEKAYAVLVTELNRMQCLIEPNKLTTHQFAGSLCSIHHQDHQGIWEVGTSR